MTSGATTQASPNRLTEIREVLGVSRPELARRAGLTRRAVRTIETGEHKPRLETARRLAAALGTSVDVVFPEASDDV